MKILITEDKLKSVIFKYFDLEKKKGNEPQVSNSLSNIFGIPESVLFEYLGEYLGVEESIRLTKEKLKNLPDSNMLIEPQLDGELFFRVTDIGDVQPYKNNELDVFVECFGNVENAQVWDAENDDYIYGNYSLDEWFSLLDDMTSVWEIKDILKSDVAEYLYEHVTRYTSIDIFVESLSITEG